MKKITLAFFIALCTLSAQGSEKKIVSEKQEIIASVNEEVFIIPFFDSIGVLELATITRVDNTEKDGTQYHFSKNLFPYREETNEESKSFNKRNMYSRNPNVCISYKNQNFCNGETIVTSGGVLVIDGIQLAPLKKAFRVERKVRLVDQSDAKSSLVVTLDQLLTL